MHTSVSSSFFGLFTLTALALGGCAVSTEASSETHSGQGVEVGDTTPSRAARLPAAPGATPAPDFSVAPRAPGAELSDLELTYPKQQNPVPSAIGLAPSNVGPMFDVSQAAQSGKCASDADCGVSGCYEGASESFFCDASGTCQVSIEACGFYACGESACLTSCQSDGECSDGASCIGGRCEAK
ncbi:MAG: hypothetical protein U0263_17360 [Polyangiaceae bacterium]